MGTGAGAFEVTIRIPRWALVSLFALGCIGGAAVGGYVLGRDSRSGLPLRIAALSRQEARLTSSLTTHEQNTLTQLRNLCREVIRLHPAFGYFDGSSCSSSDVPDAPSREQSIQDHDYATFQAIASICNDVLQIQGSTQTFGGSRTNCAEGLRPVSH